MLTIFPAHARADAALAGELARYLERGARGEVLLAEGLIGPGDTLLSKLEEGQSADVILALLSPDAACGSWRREEWVPAFQAQPQEAGVDIAVLLARPCKFPDLLRRRNFFDLSRDFPGARRALKRWLIGLRPPPRPPLFAPGKIECFAGAAEDLETLRNALAEEPGTAVVFGPERSGKTALALEFARRHEDDFEWMVWLYAAGRGLAEIAGDFAAQLGLRLESNLAGNLAQIRYHCAGRRCLVVVDGASEPETAQLVPGGHTSVLVTTNSIEVSAAFPGSRIELDGPHDPPGRPLGLNMQERKLLEAINACAPGGFEPEEAAALAGLDESGARAALASLHTRGLMRQLDRNTGSLWMGVLASPPSPELSELQARIAARRGARWASHPEPERLLGGLRHALQWSLSRDDEEAWNLSRSLAQTATAILRNSGRLAEAMVVMQQLELAARRRGDRRALETCLWEQAWILEAWGENRAAEALHRERTQFCADQMSLPFAAE